MQGKEWKELHKVYKLTFLCILLHVVGNIAHVVPKAHQIDLQEYIGRLTFSSCKREDGNIAVYHEINDILCYWDSFAEWPLCVERYNLFEDEYSHDIILYIVKASNENNGVYVCETTDPDVMEYLHDRDSIPLLDLPYVMKFECNIYEGSLVISHPTKGQLCSWTKQDPVICSGKYNLSDDYRRNYVIFSSNEASSEDDGSYTCEFSGIRRAVQVYNHGNREVRFACQRRNKDITIFNQTSDPLCHWKHGQSQATCLEHYSLTEDGKDKNIILNILHATEEDDGFYFCEYHENGVKILEYKNNRPVTRILTEDPVPSPEVHGAVPDVRAAPIQVNESYSAERIGRIIFDCKKGSDELAIYNDDIGTLCYWDVTEQQYTCMEKYSLGEDEITRNVIMYILKASDADNGLYMCESDEMPSYLIEYHHERDSIPVVDLPYKMKFECNVYQGYLNISHPTKGELCHWNKASTTICNDKYMLSVDYNISHIVFTIIQPSADDNGIYTCEFEGFRKDVRVYNHNNNQLRYLELPVNEIIGRVHFACQRRNSKIVIINEYNQILCTWASGPQHASCLEDYRLTEEANTKNIILFILNATEEDDGLYACVYRISGNRTQKYQHNFSDTDDSADERGLYTTRSSEETAIYTTSSLKERDTSSAISLKDSALYTTSLLKEERDDINIEEGSMTQVIIGVIIGTTIFIFIFIFIMYCICKKGVQIKKTSESIPMKEETKGHMKKESEDPTERTPMKTSSAI